MELCYAKRSQSKEIARLIMSAMSEDCCRWFAGPDHTLADFERMMTTLVEREDSQYSYKNTLVALTEDQVLAGILVSYDGADLLPLRRAFIEEAKTFAIKEQINRRNLSGQALLDAVANFNFEKGKGNVVGEKGKASEIIAKQIGVSAKTVEKTRLVLKEASPEQLEAIKKDEISMNQVYKQIR